MLDIFCCHFDSYFEDLLWRNLNLLCHLEKIQIILPHLLFLVKNFQIISTYVFNLIKVWTFLSNYSILLVE